MDRDGFSVISLTSLGSTVSHRVLSSAEELNELNSTLGVPDERLSSFALRLYQLHQHVGYLETALNSASAISGRLQTTLSQSLGSCDVVSTVLNKQVMRLQAETLPMLDEVFLMVYNDAVLAFTRLFAFFAKILSLSSRDEQDATLDSKSGREIFDHVNKACEKASQVKDILTTAIPQSSSFASSSKGPFAGDIEPPPYEPAQASSPQSPGPSNGGSGFTKGLSSLTSSFKAMTSGLWPKPDPLSTALCQAALRGDVQQMSGLLAQGANINGRNGEGNAPLSCAILANQENAVKFLLGAGADTNSKDLKMPPVFLAASVGSIGVAKMLIDQGTWNANAARFSGQSYFVDVCNSENLEGIRLLLENGSKPNVTNTSGRPVIAQAVKKGNIELVRLLLRHGANPDSSDATGTSILAIAASQDRIDILKLLLENGTNASAKGMSGLSVLADCVIKRKLDMVELLLERGANASAKDLYGHPVLVIALRDSKLSEAEKIRLVKSLLDHGASPNVSDGTWGVAAICFAMETGSTDLVRMMLQAGSNTRKKMNNGETLLLYAIDNGRRDQAKLLLEAGADANAADKKGRTPLMQAISRRDTELIRLLSAHGADANVGGCISPAELAQSMGDLDILQILGFGSSPQVGGPVARPHSPPPGYDTSMGKV
ncbi:ankyrin protein [Fusarium heterosporum]|uniref:Ankyrin protein n=1 Tax=Fusarium heterosporum TaxID=42747 RepID=A0A8H5TUT7_FUSHE|nr:ankyrin protein [Fusarium heterosporum]